MRARSERGSAAVEAVVLLPVLLLVTMMALQLGVAGWAASQTEEAARQAARAHSLGESWESAAERALPGSLQLSGGGASADTVRLEVRVPRVSILPRFTVEREVSMPRSPSAP